MQVGHGRRRELRHLTYRIVDFAVVTFMLTISQRMLKASVQRERACMLICLDGRQLGSWVMIHKANAGKELGCSAIGLRAHVDAYH